MKQFARRFSNSWKEDQVGNVPVWRVLAWAGSFGLGLTAFLFLADRSHFEYHSFEDIVATPAFLLYPKQQDWWLYLAALIIVPSFTLAGYRAWVILVTALQKIQPVDKQDGIIFVTLSYGLWWIHPLTYLYVHRLAPMPLAAALGLFVVGNGIFIAYHGFQRRALANSLDTPPSLALQGAIALLGGTLGGSLLTSPLGTPFLGFPARMVLGLALGLWGIWLGGAFLLGRMLHRQWRVVAESLAVGCLPLSMFFLQDVLWWEVRQGGERVARYGSSAVAMLLPIGAVTVSVVVSFWALRALVNEKRVLWDKVFWRWFFGLTVPLLLYALAYSPNIHGPVDLFHEGERVSPAQALMAGRIPYKDVVFVHGFLRDPGVALAAFRIFGPSIAGLRTLEQLLFPLALVSTYYLMLACLGGRWALLYSVSALTGLWPLFYDWRIVPSVAALACLVIYIRQGRAVWATGAGLLTFMALATSFDLGTVSLVAGVALCIALTLVRWRKIKFTLLLAYFIPLFSCIVVVLLYFASVRALGPFVAWHWQILTVYRDWNGMPFPARPDTLGQVWEAFLSPLSSVMAIMTLIMAVVRRQWVQQHWSILLLLVANVTLFNRAIVSGSVVGSALVAGSHFAPLLLLLLLTSSAYVTGSKHAEELAAATLVLSLLLPTPTHPLSGRTLLDIVNQLPAKTRVVVPSSWVQSSVERVGPLFVPPEQERIVAELVRFLKGAESFWDFTDHGALYFLSGHQSPTRFYATHHIITGQNQREVIADLARTPPRYVLFRSGTGWDAIVGVDRCLRSFLAAEYLLKNYHPIEQVGEFAILERGKSSSFPVGPFFRVDAGYVPFLWGKDRSQILKTFDSTTIARWDFTLAGDMNGWEPARDVSSSEVKQGGWYIYTAGSDAQLQNLALNLDPRSVTYLVLRMRVEGPVGKELKAQLFWRSVDKGFAEKQSLLFNIVPDGQDHIYLLRLASFPSWMWNSPVTGLRLDPGDVPGIGVTIHSIELVKVNELEGLLTQVK